MVVSRQFERIFDLRTIRRNIRGGLLTKEKFEEYLRSLPDMSENIAPVSSMDDDSDGKPLRGEGSGVVAPPSFPRRLDMPVDTDEDLDALGDDDDDDDDDDLEDEDEVDEVAVAPAAAAPAVVAAPPVEPAPAAAASEFVESAPVEAAPVELAEPAADVEDAPEVAADDEHATDVADADEPKPE